jgi:PAS domain S-box-containing protein
MFNTQPEPILLITAILLTIMATYTSIDLLTLNKTSERNNRFLFAGGIASMSIGLWIMSFLMMSSINQNTFVEYDILSAMISLGIGFTFTLTAFYIFLNRKVTWITIIIGSIFMTTAVLCIHLFTIFSLHLTIHYNLFVTIITLTIVFISFFATFWLLYGKNLTNLNLQWNRPVASLIITFGVGQAYYFLNIQSTIKNSTGIMENSTNSISIFIYIALFYSFLLLGGLILMNTFINNRLKESDSYLKDISAALDAASIVVITDPRGNIIYANDKFVEISKYSREELIGQNHRILNSGYHPREFFKELWRTIGTGNVWKGEIRNRAKDGSFYWVDTTIVPFMNSKGKPYQYLSIRNDITQKKKTEEMIHRQEKLAVVGQLAAGIAHEIRNPLTSMKGYAEFLTLEEENLERREYLEIILDEIDRIDSIVEDFMVLAKPAAEKIEVKNLIPIMQNVISLMEYEARKSKVKIHSTFEHNEILAVVDENRIKQVFLNFIKNAIEAMPQGGDLWINIHKKDDQIHIFIKDNGVGMSQDVLKKIGEPFYTTKEKGTGLGLMTSFKIIESHRGKLFVESEVNKGTEFHITLPIPESE